MPKGLWAAAALVGCYPNAVESFADTQVVVTRFDPGTFGDDAPAFTARTYSRPDRVPSLTPVPPPEPSEPDARPLEQTVFERIDENLRALGYERVTGDAEPTADLHVFAAVGEPDWRSWRCYDGWPYWGWWEGLGVNAGPATAWCYPGPVSDVVWDVGTLFIDLADRRRLTDENGAFDVVWSAAINGVLALDAEIAARELERTVDRAFAQSGYLRVQGATP